jgi:hypothetical protein
VQRLPAPAAAKLPPSARTLLQPFRKDNLDLTVAAHNQLQYQVGMQAGATLVYAWSGQRALSYEFSDKRPSSAAEGHGAFVAQSSGWYRWRWSNPTGDSVKIHLKLSGYYEPAVVPPVGMPYDK